MHGYPVQEVDTTPLLVAAKWGRTDAVELLLNNNATVDVEDKVSLI